MLKGENVVLRPVRRSDISHLLRWFNDPEVIQYLLMYLPMTEMAEEKYIEELGTTRAKTDVIFVIEVTGGESMRPVGTVALHNIDNKNHEATFGIAIGEKDCWSKGYGTEATRLITDYGFEQLNLHRISSSALSFNDRSIRMHRGIGFVEEGRQRESIFKNGEYCDIVVFGLLKREWEGYRR
jgi:RimJ/RimL family protein N-acetyltransferase